MSKFYSRGVGPHEDWIEYTSDAASKLEPCASAGDRRRAVMDHGEEVDVAKVVEGPA